MKVNSFGIDLIKSFESCKLSAYQDLGGVWTIGWGHTRSVNPWDQITQTEADLLFLDDMDQVCQQLLGLLKKRKIDLGSNQFSALTSFTYNVGVGNLMMSLLLRCIETGHLMDSAEEFLKWDKVNGRVVNGLTRRRKEERLLFLKP